GDKERDAQRLNAVCQDVVLEMAFEDCNGVEGNGTTNQDFFRHSCISGLREELIDLVSVSLQATHGNRELNTQLTIGSKWPIAQCCRNPQIGAEIASHHHRTGGI